MITFYSRIPEINLLAYKLEKYTGDEKGVLFSHSFYGYSVVRIEGEFFISTAVSTTTGAIVETKNLIKDFVFCKSYRN